jgi:hypothetical protein
MPSNNVAVSLGGRTFFHAIKMPNGHVIAGGGTNFDVATDNSAPVDPNSFWSDWRDYDPVADDWTAIASCPERISGSTPAAVLADGEILFAGFNSPSDATWPSGAATTSVEKHRFAGTLHTYGYNYLTDTWTQYGDLDRRRMFGRLVPLSGGGAAIVGGFADFQAQGLATETIQLWSRATGLWTTFSMPAIPEEEATSAAVIGPAALTSIARGLSLFGAQFGTVNSVRVDGLVPTQRYIGGTIALSGTSNSTIGTGLSFTKVGNVVTMTKSTGTTFLTTASIGMPIIIAGSTSPANDGTFIITSVPSASSVTYVNAAGVAEAYAGGWTIKRNDGTYVILNVLYDTAGNFSRVYYYNTNSLAQAGAGGTYTITEVTPGARYNPTVHPLPDNKVLIAGGNRPPCLADGGVGAVSLTAGVYTDLVPNSESMRKSALVFDATTNTFVRVQNMHIARDSAKSVSLPGGLVLIVGGISANHGIIAACEIFDPATGIMYDGALMDPLRNPDGTFDLFQGFAGNPPSGTSPAPGIVLSMLGALFHFDYGLIGLPNGNVVSIFGMGAIDTNPVLYNSPAVDRISLYRPGAPSQGNQLDYVP